MLGGAVRRAVRGRVTGAAGGTTGVHRRCEVVVTSLDCAAASSSCVGARLRDRRDMMSRLFGWRCPDWAAHVLARAAEAEKLCYVTDSASGAGLR